MAADPNSTTSLWWLLARAVVWIDRRIEMPPRDAERTANSPEMDAERALTELTNKLFTAVYGAPSGMPIAPARVLCGSRYVDLADLIPPPPSLEPGALDALVHEMRKVVRRPGIEFNPDWLKRTWPAPAPAVDAPVSTGGAEPSAQSASEVQSETSPVTQTSEPPKAPKDWLAGVRKDHPRQRNESMAAYARRLYPMMPAPMTSHWVESTVKRRLFELAKTERAETAQKPRRKPRNSTAPANS
jgi:hypothetical protein